LVVGLLLCVGDVVGWWVVIDDLVCMGVVDDVSYVYWDVWFLMCFLIVEVWVVDVVFMFDDVVVFVVFVCGLVLWVLDDYCVGCELLDLL